MKNIFGKILCEELELVKNCIKTSKICKEKIGFTLYEAFLAIAGNDKYITEEHLYKFLIKNNINIDTKDMHQLMFRLDADNDGKISFDEFKEIFFPIKDEENIYEIKEENNNIDSNFNNKFENKNEIKYDNVIDFTFGEISGTKHKINKESTRNNKPEFDGINEKKYNLSMNTNKENIQNNYNSQKESIYSRTRNIFQLKNPSYTQKVAPKIIIPKKYQESYQEPMVKSIPQKKYKYNYSNNPLLKNKNIKIDNSPYRPAKLRKINTAYMSPKIRHTKSPLHYDYSTYSDEDGDEYFKNKRLKQNKVSLTDKRARLMNEDKVNKVMGLDYKKIIMKNQKEKTFDFQLYSRQLVCDGVNSFKKLMRTKIFIYGMRGLGVEVAKNIILKGPEKVSIFDPRKAEIQDMNSNFYLDEADVEIKRKDESVLKKLQVLNENVTVNFLDKNSIEEIIEILPNNYDVVVITEAIPNNLSIRIDKLCRKNKIYFIYSTIFGLTGFLFNDFGEKHIIEDETGAELDKFMIKSIEKNGDNGIVTIILPRKNSFICNGSFVKFRDIKGMTELNYENEKKFRKIKKLNNNNDCFYIGDISNYSDYIEGGIVEKVNIPLIMNHRTLEERFKEPFDLQRKKEVVQFTMVNRCLDFNTDDTSKNLEIKLIFLSIISIFNFLDEKKRLPKLNSKDDSNIIIKKTRELYEEVKQNNNQIYKDLSEFDENIPKYISILANTQIPCMTSFLGGIIAQEIIKTTGIYIPINQWQIFDFLEFLPNENLRTNLKEIPINRYTDEIAIFGEKIINDLQNTKILLAGAGAVGCEMMKNLALLGIGDNKKEPHITVVDFDKVELSNLNRQFLFLRNSIGKTKVEAAASSVEKINKNIKIFPIFEKFCKEKDNIFNHDFFKEKDFILISIDTLNGKEYLDKKSILFDIPMLLGAIRGPRAKSESYIPYETACFSDLSLKTSINTENEVTPSCTIRYFPKRIEDCMDWARNYFDDLFIFPIQKLKKIFKDEEYFVSLKNDKNENSTKEIIINLIDLLNIIVSDSIESIIKYGLTIFLENFTLWCNRVFKEYPLDKKNEDGTPF